MYLLPVSIKLYFVYTVLITLYYNGYFGICIQVHLLIVEIRFHIYNLKFEISISSSSSSLVHIRMCILNNIQ